MGAVVTVNVEDAEGRTYTNCMGVCVIFWMVVLSVEWKAS